MNRQGFTLLELLVAMALVGVVLLALNSVFVGTLSATNNIQSRNEIIQDLQIAQQLTANKVREAWYVFPSNSGTLTFTAGASVTNPITDTSAWNFSTHPILAMILPPRIAGSCTAISTDACYTFYAYYPVKRTKMVGTLLTPDTLGADSINDASVWTLMEYRRPYLAAGAPATTLSAVPTAGTGRILADYLQPTTVSSTYTMFTRQPTTGPVTSVTLSLRGKVTRGANTLYVPGETETLTTAAAPQNLGK